jgi:hypothetical protein
MKNTQYYLVETTEKTIGVIVFRKLRKPENHIQKFLGSDYTSFNIVDKKTFYNKSKEQNGMLIL